MPPCCCLTTTALLAALQNRRAGERDYEEVVAVEDLDHEVVGVMEEDLVDVDAAAAPVQRALGRSSRLEMS